MLAVVLLSAAAAAWVGVRGLQAKAELEAALPLASTVKAQALAANAGGVTAAVNEMAVHTERAHELTGDPIWRVAEFVPFAGPNLTAMREIARITDELLIGAGKPLATIASTLDPAILRPVDGVIDLQPFVTARPVVTSAAVVFTKAYTDAQSIDTSQTISQVTSAVDQLTTLLASTAPALASGSELLKVLPDALGASGPREYVIMFQNNAEARALGGTALSFSLLSMDGGRMALGDVLPAGYENFSQYFESVVPIPDGVESIFPIGGFGTFIANATVRPSFATAAQITHEMWKRQFGTDIDGVISVDPVALSYVLRVTEPIPISTGDVITTATVVPILLNEIYNRYSTGDVLADNEAQDAVYAEVVASTFSRLSSGQFDPELLMTALTQATSERRVLFWSPKADEQAAFESLNVDGPLPKSDKATDRVGVYFHDNVGSKMNYYLHQSVSLGQAACRDDGKLSYRIGVAMANGIPAAAVETIGPSILGQFVREKLDPGVQRMIVMIYAPPGSQITGATENGVAVQLEQLHDTDHPVAKFTVTIEPGATVSMSVDLVTAGAGEKALEAQYTPMVNATKVEKVPLDCATVAVG